MDFGLGTRDPGHFCEWARWVGEKIWHESQKITKLPDGGLEMTFRVAGLDEIKRWVLSLGPEALVLEPKRLWEMVQKDLAGTLQQYRGICAKARAEIRDAQASI